MYRGSPALSSLAFIPRQRHHPSTMKRWMLTLVGGALLLGGCTYPMIDFTKSAPSVRSGSEQIAVSGIDIRPDILSKDYQPNYVGAFRGFFSGIPYHLNTTHQQALVSQLVDAVTVGYKKSGYSAEAVYSPNLGSRASAISALQKTSAHRFLLVTVRALYTNTLVHTEITYDVTLEVLNRSGHTLAHANAQAEEKLLNGAAFPAFYVQKLLPDTMADVLTGLSQSKEIRNALK